MARESTPPERRVKFDPDKHCGAHPDHEVKGPCCAPKGAGTPHPGIGRCKHHGGLTPKAIAAGRAIIQEREMEQARQDARALGVPEDIHPTEGLLREIAISAGAIRYYREQIDRVVGDRPDNLVFGQQTVRVTDSSAGTITVREVAAMENMWHKLWRQERVQFAALCALALRAGVEERRVKIAEQQGSALAGVIRGILDDLDLTPAQRAKIGEIVPRHLRAIAS